MNDKIKALIDLCILIDSRLDVERDETPEEEDGEKVYILAGVHQELKDRIAAVRGEL